MSKENAWGATIRKALRERGAMVYPLVAGRDSPVGWPDILVWHQLWCGLIELKGPGTKFGPLQLQRIGELNIRRPRSSAIYRQDPKNSHAGDLSYVSGSVEIMIRSLVFYDRLLDELHDWYTESWSIDA